MRALYDRKRIHGGIDGRIARVAAARHGVFTRGQATECGATEGAIRWRLKAGRWECLHPGVYKIAGTPTSWRQRAIAACLHFGPGAVLSHRAAAVLQGLQGFKPEKTEVTVPRNRNRIRLREVVIHGTQDPIPEEDITRVDGIPVTKPARTLMDLAAVVSEEVLETALDDAVRRRLVSVSFLDRWLEDPRRKRRRGARKLRRLVDLRATVGVAESPLETRVLKLLRKAGLPVPMLQYVVRDGRRFVARLDFAYPVERVAIEADGFRYHDGRREFDDERARGNEIQAMGWRVLRITSKHLDRDPDGVAAWVRRALLTRPL